MIASLSGRIASIEDDRVVVEVGGVGLLVYLPEVLCREMQIGQMASVHTYLVVRETELTLYGFATAEERQFFALLLGVNGVGPRLALAILSSLNPDSIRRAVFSEQAEVFSRVPGVGKKTAQKILLHLGDRIPSVEGLEPVAMMDDVDVEVLAALTTLGYSVVEAQAALQTIPQDAPQDVEERLRIALGYFFSPL